MVQSDKAVTTRKSGVTLGLDLKRRKDIDTLNQSGTASRKLRGPFPGDGGEPIRTHSSPRKYAPEAGSTGSRGTDGEKVGLLGFSTLEKRRVPLRRER